MGHLESDRRSYARAGDVLALREDINERRQEIDERMQSMATTRDLASVREVLQVHSAAMQREVEQARQERHGDRRVLDDVNRTLAELLRHLQKRNGG